MDRKWWQDAIVYQIYPLSFQDSDNDGIGDIKGIISRLDYLKDLGINVIWLSPVYDSPMDDNGYDIKDYKKINPLFGTMDDMDELISTADKKGIKIIMDLVINHTSDEHEWFIKSRDRNSEYRNYYYWREPKENGSNPNNWTTFFGEDAWSKDEETGDYYLHLFSKKQPDLNYHNPKVLEEIEDIIDFWLKKGIAGFRCDVINIIWKKTLDDGKKQFALTGIEHYMTSEGTHNILKKIKKDVMSKYDCFTVGETVLVGTKDAKDLCDPERKELDMVFQFEQLDADQIYVKWFKKKFSPKQFYQTLSKWQEEIYWNAVYLENHDQPRSISRYCSDPQYYKKAAKLFAILLFTLKGTPFIYQGEEIGMTNFDYTSMDQIMDVESFNIYALAQKLHFPKNYIWKMMTTTSRDNARTPMQWDDTENAGFTKGSPWLDVNSNYRMINVKAETRNKDSVLNFYKELINIRRNSDILTKGEFKKIHYNDQIFVFERTYAGKSYKIALNMSNRPYKIGLHGKTVCSNYGEAYFTNELKPWQGVILE